MTIVAPSSGTLILTETIFRDPQSVNFFSIHPEKGLFINKGSLIAYLVKGDSLIVKVTIPERKIEKIKLGSSARVSLTAVSDSRYQYFEGTLKKISTSAQNGEFLGTIELGANDLKDRLQSIDLLVGTTVNARIKLGRTTMLEKIQNIIGD
jgi:hypothetical protein